jgi:hypothetical protein
VCILRARLATRIASDSRSNHLERFQTARNQNVPYQNQVGAIRKNEYGTQNGQISVPTDSRSPPFNLALDFGVIYSKLATASS